MNMEREHARLFPEGPYKFHLGIMRRSLEEYFADSPEPQHSTILAERKSLLDSDAVIYAAAQPNSGILIDDAIEIARQSLSLTEDQVVEIRSQATPEEQLRHFGSLWESDFCLLQQNNNEFTLKAGVICFPSSWSLPDKMGQPLSIIHEPVTNLNEQIGRNIQSFMEGMPSGDAWDRVSWGLSSTPKLNQHPSLELPKLTEAPTLKDTFLRIENTALIRLPQSGGVMFAIRVKHIDLENLRNFPVGHAGLLKALKTMPVPTAIYKGIEPARAALIDLLSSAHPPTNQ